MEDIKRRRKQTYRKKQEGSRRNVQIRRGRRRILTRRKAGRPCIEQRKQRITNPTGREKETIEEGEDEEIGGKEKVEAQEYKDAETEGLIREYQKNAKPTQATMKIL